MARKGCGGVDGHHKPDCGFSPTVLQIMNKDCTLFHSVTIPAIMGDETEMPPNNGLYKNVLLYYEASGNAYLYTSDGIPIKLTYATTDYNALTNKPTINGVTIEGNLTPASLGININDATLTIKQGDTTLGTFSANAAENVEINVHNVYEIETFDNEQYYRIYKNGILINDVSEAYRAISEDATAQEIKWRANPSAVFYHKCPGSEFGLTLNCISGRGEGGEECGSEARVLRIMLQPNGECAVEGGDIAFKTRLAIRYLYMGADFIPNGTYEVTSNNPVINASELDSDYQKLLRYFLYEEPDPTVVLTADYGQTGHTLVLGDVDFDTENGNTVIKMSLMSVAHQEIYNIIFRQDGTYSVINRYKITTTDLMA